MAAKRKHRKQAGRKIDAPLPPPLPELGPERYFNRELSWLEFNRRVLGQALETRHPLLERVKFLAIFSSNLDEFFMVRVAGLRAQVDAGVRQRSPDGRTPAEQLALIKPVVDALNEQQRCCLVDDLMPQLVANGILIKDYADLDRAERRKAEAIFEREVFPVLTPLAFDPGHPFPHISNLSLNLAVVVHGPEGEERFARIKIPEVLPRLVSLPVDGRQSTVFVWLEQLIAANLTSLFPGMEVRESYPFRITRSGDVDLQEEEAADLLRTIEHGVRQRQFGPVVRLSVDATMPGRILDILVDNLEMAPEDVYHHDGTLGLRAMMELSKLDRPELKYPSFLPALPRVLEETDDLWSAVQAQDILLHHPYESFLPVVDFIRAAAADPQVLAIKQTLYRVGSDTPLVDALVEAREKGKQVTVLVELKARFDEENNIEWARTLESAGVHVVYGLVGLKTHGKVALVVRRERDRLRRYVHLSTGNYNVATAHLYTDIGMLTCRPDIGADASELFNYLTGYTDQRAYRKFLVAPVNLRETLLRLIERESALALAGQPARLILKSNTLTDPDMIESLYDASSAGVKIDLIIRGVCCLRPGVPGLSENITVRSIVGRFLEHSRIYYFQNGGAEEVYVGSADLMSRNLDRRVEVVFPVEDPALIARLREGILQIYLRDTINAHVLGADGTYVRPSGELCDSQAWFLERGQEPQLPPAPRLAQVAP
jgi:polyphosphate kinase